MAVFHGTIRSTALSMDTGLSVVLPYDRPAEIQKRPCKTLYLLHGMGENSQAWLRYTGVERYARDKGLALVFPEVQRSFYTDMYYGMHYFTYISQELPRLCGEMFHIGTAREDTYIAGLSMGGYGAVKCAFTYPDRYAGCASFSGAVNIVQVVAEHADSQNPNREFVGILGPELPISDDNNPLVLASRVAKLPAAQHPKLFLTCGQQDFLYSSNLSFKRHLESLPLHFTYREWPGIHNWDFWDESIRQMLELYF